MSILHVLSPNTTVTEDFINNLNQSEILRLINAGEKENVLQYLGGVGYDEEGKIVSEVYKIFVDDLKLVTINKKDQKIMIERKSGSEEILLNDLTSESKQADQNFHDKDKKSKWDRWGKDVTQMMVGGGFKLAGAAIGKAKNISG